MSYYNRYRGQRKHTSEADAGGPIDEPDAIFELGKNKRVTVRHFRNINLIDIREYYADAASGEMKPGKKGISLTEELYDELLKHRQNIDDALRRFGSKRPRTKTVNVLSDNENYTPEPSVPAKKRKTEKSDQKPAPKRERRRVPAPPQSQPDEKRRKNDHRESSAKLVIPGAGNSNYNNNPGLDDIHTPPASSSSSIRTAAPSQSNSYNNPRLDDHLPRLSPVKKPDNDSGLDSSDEDFALALESEFNRENKDNDDNDSEDGNISEES